VAPAKTPQPVVAKMHADFNAVLDDADSKAAILRNGMLPVPTTSVDNLKVFVSAEVARWGKVVQQAGLTGSQ